MTRFFFSESGFVCILCSVFLVRRSGCASAVDPSDIKALNFAFNWASTETLAIHASLFLQFSEPTKQWLKWKSIGVGTVIWGFGPLLVVVGPLLTVLDHLCPCWWSRAPETTKLTSLSGNQALHLRLWRGFWVIKMIKLCKIQCTARRNAVASVL